MQSCGVRCSSVHPSICKHFANRFFSQAEGWIATKLAHDGPQAGLHPGCAQGQGRGQRSRDTDTCYFTKIPSSRRQMVGMPPTLHTMVCWWACIQGVLKVKVEVKCHSSRGETVCQTVCYTVRSHVLSLHALTLWNTIILSFQYKYQAARYNV